MAKMFDRVSAAVGFAFVVAVAGAVSGCGGGKSEAHSAADESDGEKLPVGSPAPDLSIQTINGKGKISNDSLKGKIAVIDFWATWCGPCKTSFPKLEELSKKHSGKVEVVGVSVDEEKGGIADFAKENGATFAIGWDEGHTIASRWKVKAMPTTVILDAAGNVRHVHPGFHDDEPERIANELTALLAEPASSDGATKTEVASSSSSSSSSGEAKSEEPKKEEAKEEDDEAPPPPVKKAGKKGGGKKAGGKAAKKKKK